MTEDGPGPLVEGGDGTEAVDDATRHEQRRRRTPRRVVVVGLPVSLVLALATGLVGAPGQLAGAVFLSLAALTVASAGSVVAVGVVVDQFRGVRVPLPRVLMTGGLLLLTLLLLVASAGAMAAAARALG